MSQAKVGFAPPPMGLFEQSGIELEERKRSLVFAMNAYAEARRQATIRVQNAMNRIKSIGRMEVGDGYSITDVKTEAMTDIVRNAEFDHKPFAPWEMSTTILRFFDEERSPLQLWKARAYEIFAACMRDMIQNLATSWNQMDLGLKLGSIKIQSYTPVANPFKQPLDASTHWLNRGLLEMQAVASQIEKTHRFKYEYVVENYRPTYMTIDEKFYSWDDSVSYTARQFARELEEKSKLTGKQLERTWFISVRNFENCFVRSFLLDGRTNGRIARAAATRLNAETDRIRSAIAQMQTNLEAEFKRLDQTAAQEQQPQADVKMQDVPNPNPSFAISAFGRQIIPPAFPPFQSKVALGPSDMDISKIGGQSNFRLSDRRKQELAAIRRRAASEVARQYRRWRRPTPTRARWLASSLAIRLAEISTSLKPTELAWMYRNDSAELRRRILCEYNLHASFIVRTHT